MEKWSFKTAWRYIVSDYYRYSDKGTVFLLLDALTARNNGFAYTFWLRLSRVKGVIGLMGTWMHYRLSRSYSVQIPRSTKIGYGFYIGHGVCIIVNGDTTIGNNVNLSHFVSIGTNKNTPATIGDNVYIAPNVSIVEDVHIGEGAAVGAGAVVINDVPANSTVAGVPAKVVSNKGAAGILGRTWKNKKI